MVRSDQVLTVADELLCAVRHSVCVWGGLCSRQLALYSSWIGPNYNYGAPHDGTILLVESFVSSLVVALTMAELALASVVPYTFRSPVLLSHSNHGSPLMVCTFAPILGFSYTVYGHMHMSLLSTKNKSSSIPRNICVSLDYVIHVKGDELADFQARIGFELLMVTCQARQTLYLDLC